MNWGLGVVVVVVAAKRCVEIGERMVVVAPRHCAGLEEKTLCFGVVCGKGSFLVVVGPGEKTA